MSDWPQEPFVPERLAQVPIAETALELRSHRVRVLLNNGFSQTTIEQTLANPTDGALEATYSFPLPEDASLSELSITVDGVRMIGEVTEKGAAEAIYKAEREAGEDAALAVQNGCFDYRVSIARVPARSEVVAHVVYFQSLEIDQGVGTYVYPLTPGNTDEGSMDSSFWNLGSQVQSEFAIDVDLKTSFPVTSLHSPSHPSLVANAGSESSWTARYVESGGSSLDRDFVLHYRLDESTPARVEFLTSRRAGQAEGTFMAVVTPGADLEPIRSGTDWFFVLDISGSMEGEKLQTMKLGVSRAISALGPRDRFQVLAFNDRKHRLTGNWIRPGSGEAMEAKSLLEGLRAGGSTNVFTALHGAYDHLDADRPSALLLVSDGVSNAGPTEYRDFIHLAKRHDTRLFTFVMGNGSNRPLLEDLATMSGGFAKSVSVQEEIGAHLMLARDRMSHEALHGVRFELDGVSAVHPRILPSLYLGQQLVVFGKYARSGSGELRVRAKISGQEQTWTVPVELPELDEANPEIERLYALAAIRDLQRAELLEDRNADETRENIVDVACAYSLVTDYTAMVVVSSGRKSAYDLGSLNADRRARENEAARIRSSAGNHLQVQQGSRPLAGSTAANAPARARRRAQSGSGGGGSSGGMGAIGPVELLGLAALIALGVTRRAS